MLKNLFGFFKKGVADKYSLFKSVNLQGDGSLSPSQYLSINEVSLYVNKGVNKRADKVGQIDFTLTKNGKPVESHWVLSLLDKPNSQMTGDTFWRLVSIHHDVCGFAIIRKIGNKAVFTENQKIEKLELLNPVGMNIVYEGERIKAFEVNNWVTGTKSVVPFDECIYWVNPNPKKPTEGISLLRAGLYSIDLDNQLSRYHNAVLKNGGSVESVFTFENVLSKEQLETLKETYREEYADASNSGTPLFLGGNADYKKLGLTPSELAYLDAKKITIDDMAVITGVPKAILGLASGETFSNADIAYRIFLRETIKPLMQDLVNVLDWRLVPKDMDLGFVDPTPEDIETKLKLVETADKVNAVTTNEKREMLGLEPIKGADDILVPLNRVPKDETKEKSSRPIFIHPLKDKKYRERYFKYHTKSLQNNKNKFEVELGKYFDGQEKRILANVEGKKLNLIKRDLHEIFNIELEVQLAYPLLNLIKEIAKEAGQDTYDMFMTGSDFVFSSSLDASLTNRFNFWVDKINETTAEKLTKELTDWTSNEETLNQLVDRIKEVTKETREWRARTIANTEIGIATQEARLDGYKQIGIPTKVWVWSPGIKGGVRDNHLSLDGEEVPINGFFSNGMRHPQDPSFGADEICNCECTL